MVISRKLILLCLIFSALINLSAFEFVDGNIRLTINERNGLFSLFYLSDPERMRYEPLFYSAEPASSFLAVNIDGRIYRLDQSRDFAKNVEIQNGYPVITFESNFLRVSVVFTPVRTVSSPFTNGVGMTITVQNTGDSSISAGLRVLIDTHLGEERGSVPFSISDQDITREIILNKDSGDRYWISQSRSKNISLM